MKREGDFPTWAKGITLESTALHHAVYHFLWIYTVSRSYSKCMSLPPEVSCPYNIIAGAPKYNYIKQHDTSLVPSPTPMQLFVACSDEKLGVGIITRHPLPGCKVPALYLAMTTRPQADIIIMNWYTLLFIVMC